MDCLKRIRRPEIWMGLLGVLLLVLWMAVLPHAHLYRLPYSNQLPIQTKGGGAEFINNNKTGQNIIIDDQVFVCALDITAGNNCYHHANNGKTRKLPNELLDHYAVVQ